MTHSNKKTTTTFLSFMVLFQLTNTQLNKQSKVVFINQSFYY